MLFILRCGFWLSIVYASILWPGIFRSQGVRAIHARANADFASTSVSAAVAGATDLCRQHPSECLGDAARLATLLEKTANYRDLIGNFDAAGSADDAPSAQARDERRHSRDERLARAR